MVIHCTYKLLYDDGLISFNKIDRLPCNTTSYEQDSSNIWWQVSTQSIWAEDGSADSTTTTVTRTRMTGLGTPAPANLNLPDGIILTAQTESVDWRGNITRESTYQHTETATSWTITDSPTSI